MWLKVYVADKRYMLLISGNKLLTLGLQLYRKLEVFWYHSSRKCSLKNSTVLKHTVPQKLPPYRPQVFPQITM